jgi:hypothetical protein
MASKFGRQVVVHSVMLGVLVGTAVLAAVAGVWPVVAMLSVFVAGWAARLIVLLRVRRLGGYDADAATRPPAARINREYLLVLRTQLVGWLAAGVYFVVVHFWLGVAVAALLAYITLPLMQLIRRRERAESDAADGP